jgi:hypothetical protein
MASLTSRTHYYSLQTSFKLTLGSFSEHRNFAPLEGIFINCYYLKEKYEERKEEGGKERTERRKTKGKFMIKV